jgi:hypothetical protein
VTMRPMVGRSVGQSVVVSSPIRANDKALLLSDICGLVVGSCDNGTVLSFTSAAGLRQIGHAQIRVVQDSRVTTLFYCLRFDTLPNWRAWSFCVHKPGTELPAKNGAPFSSTPAILKADRSHTGTLVF